MWSKEYGGTVTNLIQKAVVKLCSEYIQCHGRLLIDGIICISSDEDSNQLVVKVHESLVPQYGKLIEEESSKHSEDGNTLESDDSPPEQKNDALPKFSYDKFNKRKSKAVKVVGDPCDGARNSEGRALESFKAPIIPCSRDSRLSSKKRKLSDIFGPHASSLEDTTTTEIVDNGHENSSSSEFSCMQCFGKFRSIKDLQSHNYELHTRYTCWKCFHTFSLQADLISHFGTVHSSQSMGLISSTATSLVPTPSRDTISTHQSATDPDPGRPLTKHINPEDRLFPDSDRLFDSSDNNADKNGSRPHSPTPAEEKSNAPMDLSCRSDPSSERQWEEGDVENDEASHESFTDSTSIKVEPTRIDEPGPFFQMLTHPNTPFQALNIKKKISSLHKRSGRSPTSLANPHIDIEAKEYPCSYCRSVWPGFKSFDNHTVHVHQRYPCAYCKNTFTNKNNRNRHIRAHMGQNRYECEQCGKVFTRTDSLKEHRFVHTASYQANKCWTCGTELQTKTEILAHLKKCGSRLRPKDELPGLTNLPEPKPDVNGSEVVPCEDTGQPKMLVKVENNNEKDISFSCT